jgi:hypothetical protein
MQQEQIRKAKDRAADMEATVAAASEPEAKAEGAANANAARAEAAALSAKLSALLADTLARAIMGQSPLKIPTTLQKEYQFHPQASASLEELFELDALPVKRPTPRAVERARQLCNRLAHQLWSMQLVGMGAEARMCSPVATCLLQLCQVAGIETAFATYTNSSCQGVDLEDDLDDNDSGRESDNPQGSRARII